VGDYILGRAGTRRSGWAGACTGGWVRTSGEVRGYILRGRVLGLMENDLVTTGSGRVCPKAAVGRSTRGGHPRELLVVGWREGWGWE